MSVWQSGRAVTEDMCTEKEHSPRQMVKYTSESRGKASPRIRWGYREQDSGAGPYLGLTPHLVVASFNDRDRNDTCYPDRRVNAGLVGLRGYCSMQFLSQTYWRCLRRQILINLERIPTAHILTRHGQSSRNHR